MEDTSNAARLRGAADFGCGGDIVAVALFLHHEKACGAARSLVEKSSRAAVIHPTGSGKSFPVFRLAANHPGARMLWRTPGDFRYQTQRKNAGCNAPERDMSGVEFRLRASAALQDGTEIAGIAVRRPAFLILDELQRCGEKSGKSARGRSRPPSRRQKFPGCPPRILAVLTIDKIWPRNRPAKISQTK